MPNELNERIEKALQNPVVDRHSYFQLRYFVVGKEPTTQARMWRCLRELETRRDSLKSIEYEIAEAEDQIKILQMDIEEYSHDLTPRNEVKVRQTARKISKLKDALKAAMKRKVYIEEEARFFIDSFDNLQRLEPLKPYDDMEAQTNYWTEKLTQELNIKAILRQPPDSELMKTVLALDDRNALKREVVSKITSDTKRLEENGDSNENIQPRPGV